MMINFTEHKIVQVKKAVIVFLMTGFTAMIGVIFLKDAINSLLS